jgi:pyruvate,water dikinase
MHCVPLEDARELDRVGGKARSLAHLLGAGFPVPPGFVITEDARDLGLEGETQKEIAKLFRGKTTIVRSSGIGEDGNEASFAGVLESFPGIETLDELLRAVESCWESANSERSSSYQESLGIRLAGMGVIVQEQIDAVVSGVLFTDAGGVLVGEYAPGLGDALVQGRVEPGWFVADRTSRKCLEHEEAARARLDESRITSLVCLGLEIESLFAAPQDIEWAFDRKGRLFVVQSRPITRKTPPRRQVVWSSANVAENFPEPVTPLLFSIASLGYQHYFRNLALAFGVPRRRIEEAEPAFRGIIGLQAGRIHYNLTNIHRVLRTVPYGRWLTRSFDDFVGAKGPGAERRERPIRSAFELLVMSAKTARLYFGLTRRVAEFEKTVDAFAERFTPARLKEATLAELRDALLEFLDIRCNRWLPASLADAAAMVTSGAIRALVGPGTGDLLKGLEGLVSAQPALELWDLSRRMRTEDPADFEKSLEGYVERWGFRCSGELLLTVPSLQEEPERVYDFLKLYAELDDARSPRRILAAEAEARERATARTARGPVRRTLLFLTQRSIALRERARLKQALLYSRCRLIALAMDERLVAENALDEREDVFYLTWEELVRLPGSPRDLVRERKREREEQSRLTPPEHFSLPEGARFDGSSEATVGAEGALRGIAAGSGIARGKAAVLRSASEGRRLTGNEILVAPQTDPGWGPLFPLIRGLVLERGTLLSHGAILAREFGIPSVVGVRNATTLIADGVSLEVDGDRGHVAVVE